MSDDFLEATTTIDWAVAQMETLKGRLIRWREIPPYHFVEDSDSQIGKKLIRLSGVVQPRAVINVEVGIILHSIRSSLDVLINALAGRNGHIDPKDAYFPISRSRSDFTTGKHAGRKAIKRLSIADQAIIESLEPWEGGNNPLLIALHHLDLTRKHRRLIKVSVNPHHIMIPTDSLRQGLQFRSIWAGFEDDAVVAWTGAGTDQTKIEIALEVTFREGGPVAGTHVIEALNEFASLVRSIIALFDTL